MTTTTAHILVARAARPCERCGAQIVFVRLDGGHLMPVDVEPDPAGTVAVRVDGVQRIRGRVLNADRSTPEGTERIHVVHAATCSPDGVARPRADGTVPDYRVRALARRDSPLDPQAPWRLDLEGLPWTTTPEHRPAPEAPRDHTPA